MNLYIGDPHFGHRNILNFDHRPFSDIDEMDTTMIALWNDRVRKDDHVYIIGDLIYKSDRPASWYLNQLSGHKHLIIGNHDSIIMNDKNLYHYFESIDQLKIIPDVYKHKNRQCILCHYPMIDWPHMHFGHHNDKENKDMLGSFMIYAHIHNNINDTAKFLIKPRPTALNAGCMINHYTSCSLQELIENNKKFKELSLRS